MAERVGFEPTVAERNTAFRERHHQPLGHLSQLRDYTLLLTQSLVLANILLPHQYFPLFNLVGVCVTLLLGLITLRR